jgi:hypothetical protein
VIMLFTTLHGMEKKLGGGVSSAFSNNLGGDSDLQDSANSSPMQKQHMMVDLGKFSMFYAVPRGSQATRVQQSSLAGDLRWPLPTCLCFSLRK